MPAMLVPTGVFEVSIHTSFHRGQKVRVMYKDGRPHTIGRFTKNGSGVIYLDGKKIQLRDVRSATIER